MLKVSFRTKKKGCIKLQQEWGGSLAEKKKRLPPRIG